MTPDPAWVERIVDGLRGFEEVVKKNADAILVVDRIGIIRFLNPAAIQLFGREETELIGEPFGFPVGHGETTEIDILHAGGTVRTVEMRVTELEWEEERAWLTTLRDVTDRKRQERRLRDLARELERTNSRLEHLVRTDPLTGLVNRRGFAEAIRREAGWVAREGGDAHVALLDLDDFREINKEYGHTAGDAVLVAVAEEIRAVVRGTDTAARIGGDEFMILLPGARYAEAFGAAEKVSAAIANRWIEGPGGQRIQVTVSCGVGPVHGEHSTVEDVLVAAERGLLVSKSAGKGRVSSAPALGPEAVDDFVGQKLVGVVSMPIVELETGTVRARERLCRTSRIGFAKPADLFEAALAAGVLAQVDRACFEACLRVAPELSAEIPTHVNLFPSTLIDSSVDDLLALASRVPSGSLAIELSEQLIIGDVARLVEPVLKLRNAGVSVGLDDVGYGRSTLEALVLLEPDFVKVDRRWVTGCRDNPRQGRILASLVRVSGALGTALIAEGVETEADREGLCSHGVTLGQGFLWGEPVERKATADD